jgi:hypothetical protein
MFVFWIEIFGLTKKINQFSTTFKNYPRIILNRSWINYFNYKIMEKKIDNPDNDKEIE